jgi:DNA-binding NtrC family response regulator
MGDILVVDDAAGVRKLFADLLSSQGHGCATAGDALQAAQLLERQVFDAAIVDIFMPLVDGLELLRTWRRDFPQMALIAMSGGGSTSRGTDVFDEAFAIGAAAAFRKPIDVIDLLRVVDSVLEARAKRA